MTTALEIIRQGTEQPCLPWVRRSLTRDDWIALVAALPAQPSLTLVMLWADTVQVHALMMEEETGEMLPVSTDIIEGAYPALSPARPAAAWLERMIRDLWGHVALGGTDDRPWLDHGRWPHTHPNAIRPGPLGPPPEPPEFLPSLGDDLHQVAVGPVHAGIIEPGHFRFTAQGETVVRLEIRLGYTHKGTLSLMRSKSPRAAARFAARLSGDSTVAHSIAFARATEAALATEAPPRAQALRGVMAEIERIANHLGAVGAICNDASFAFALARFGLHREAMLRAANNAFGHRLMMDAVVPGGVAGDIAPGGPEAILTAIAGVEAELPQLIRIYENSSSLNDRVLGTGIVNPDLAARFGAGGFIGRASGRASDARVVPGYAPYSTLAMTAPILSAGDVDARVRLRLAEISESIRLLRLLLADLPEGAIAAVLPMLSGEGIGWAEGFRGDIWHWLRLDNGQIASVFMRDPSWAQWPLLEAAIEGNIIADFPLCNKSFNCSYSGVDL
jgi:Ni,Fe-hydrogenase III large subunit